MKKAQNELANLSDEIKTKIIFKPADQMKVRFIKKHCWDEIRNLEFLWKAEGVAVLEIDSESFEIEGTPSAKMNTLSFLDKLAEKIEFKVCIYYRSQRELARGARLFT
jgi:hypothetical protein